MCILIERNLLLYKLWHHIQPQHVLTLLDGSLKYKQLLNHSRRESNWAYQTNTAVIKISTTNPYL